MNLTEFLPLDKSPATAAVMAAVAKAEARHFSLPPPIFFFFFFPFSLVLSHMLTTHGRDWHRQHSLPRETQLNKID